MQYVLELYYEILKSKTVEEMEVVFDLFNSGSYKNDKKAKTDFRKYLKEHPISLNANQVRQKEIYRNLLSVLR